jgi:hypothetical protein
MMKLEGIDLKSRLEAIPLKQLFYLAEFGYFDFRYRGKFGDRNPIRYPWFPGAEPNSIHAMRIWNPKALGEVSRAIEDQLRLKYTQIQTDDPQALGYAEILQRTGEAGYWPFVALWDHFQAHLQLLSCGREPGPLRPSLPG